MPSLGTDPNRDTLLLGDLRSGAATPPRVTDVRLRGLLESIVRELAEKALARRVTILLEGPTVSVSSDAAQLNALLSNLVANAVFYSHEGGTVTVAVVDDGRVHVRVTDEGIGISDEALPHIFDEYYRATEAATFNKQSTGLGLAIVKEVARKLNLDVTVTSSPGEGTRFEVAFPDA